MRKRRNPCHTAAVVVDWSFRQVVRKVVVRGVRMQFAVALVMAVRVAKCRLLAVRVWLEWALSVSLARHRGGSVRVRLKWAVDVRMVRS